MAACGLAVALVGIPTAIVQWQTAQVEHDTEEVKKRQAEIDSEQGAIASQVNDNQRRADELETRVNDLSGNQAEAAAKTVSGTWKGVYRCGQGRTGLTLTMYVEGPNQLLATFEFYPLDENPKVPHGAFAMRGSFSPSRLNLDGSYWITQPAGYSMVSLDAPISSDSQETITGKVVSSTPGCENFEITKTSTQTHKPTV